MSSKLIKICLVGNGYMAAEYSRAIKSIKRLKLVGVTGRRKKKLNLFCKKFSIKNKFLDVSEMLKIIKPDIIILAASTISNQELLIKCSFYNVIILCEKPIGYDYNSSLSIYKKINKKNKNIFIGLNRRFYSNIEYIRKSLTKNKKLVNIYDQQDLNYVKKRFKERKIIENWQYHNSIHLIDIILFLKKGDIQDMKLLYKSGIKNDLTRIVKISFTSGDVFIYNAIWNKPGPWKILISSKNYFYYFENLEKLKIYNLKKEIYDFKFDKIDQQFKPGIHSQVTELIKVYDGKNHKLKDINYSQYLMCFIKKIYDL